MPPPLGEVDSGPQDRRRRGRLRRIGLLYPARRNSPQIAKSLLHPQGSCSNPRRTALCTARPVCALGVSQRFALPALGMVVGFYRTVPRTVRPPEGEPSGGRVSDQVGRAQLVGALVYGVTRDKRQPHPSSKKHSPQVPTDQREGGQGERTSLPLAFFPPFLMGERGPRRRRPLKERGKPSR